MDKNANTVSKPTAIATVIQVLAPSSANPGDKAIISEDGVISGWVGGGCVQPAVQYAAKAVLRSGQPCVLRVAPDGEWQPVAGLTEYTSHCLGRGSILLFVEPLQSNPALHILGDSEVALSLAQLATHMSMNVKLHAPEINPDLVPSRVALQHDFSIGVADYIVIATQGQNDRRAIDAALKTSCSHIKMVVSAAKLTAMKAKLRDAGLQEHELDRLEGPAGLWIGAKLPAEIALSVLAQLIELRRSTTGSNTIDKPEIGVPGSADNNQVALKSAKKSDGGCCG